MSIVAGSRGLLALAFRDLVPMAAARLPPSNAFIVEVFRLLLCLAGGDGRLLAFRPHLFEVRVVRAPDVFVALTAFLRAPSSTNASARRLYFIYRFLLGVIETMGEKNKAKKTKRLTGTSHAFSIAGFPRSSCETGPFVLCVGGHFGFFSVLLCVTRSCNVMLRRVVCLRFRGFCSPVVVSSCVRCPVQVFRFEGVPLCRSETQRPPGITFTPRGLCFLGLS